MRVRKTSHLTIYRRFLVTLAFVVVLAQGVAFLSVNVGFPHFLKGGKPTLVYALGHLGKVPRQPIPGFLREAFRRMRGGAVVLASADRSGVGRFLRVQAVYDLFPDRVFFGQGGSVQASVASARTHSHRVRYLLLIRRHEDVPWPSLRGVRAIVDSACCRMDVLPKR